MIFAVYRPPDSSNLNSFFNELSNSVNFALEKYDNIIVFGDFNVDTQNEQHPGYNKFKSFSDTMGLQNLVKEKTCFTKNHASSIDVFLTNRPRLFQKTCVFETGLRDYHGLVVTLLKAQVPRLKAERIMYRCYKNFTENEFLSDVRLANFEIDHLSVDDAYEHITKTFRAIVDKHAPLKTKILRGNTAPFMNRDLSTGIYTRARLQRKLKKYPSRGNEAKLKKTTK